MDGDDVRRSGAAARPDGSVRWRVWAPNAGRLDLVLLDGERRRTFPMTPEDRGYFQHVLPDIPEGQRYAYRLDCGPERPDPASLWQPDGVHAASAVLRPDRFRWTDQDWKGVRRQDLVFYELHVGAFTPEGTFEAVIPRLAELHRLGVNAVELMPVGEFPGGRNWGYDGVHPYAAQHSYGGPLGLQCLVDACHAAGLAVFLDVVYNHLGPEGNYLAEFGSYFTDRYRTAWGRAMNYDGAGSDAVRDFVLDNARMWLREFHFDGLRLDAVHAIFDQSPHHILRAIQEVAEAEARRAGRPVHVVAESDLNDPRLLWPPSRGGYGLDAQWADDLHHVVHTYLTGERQGYYQDYGAVQDLPKVLKDPFLAAGAYSPFRGRKHGAPAGDLPGDRFVVCLQNHDQVGNRARGDRLAALVDPPAQRLAASLMLLSPYLPLLFMGEEYGEDRPFLFFCSFGDDALIRAVREGRRNEFAAFAWQGEVPDPQDQATFQASQLTWLWPEGGTRAGLRRLYMDLLTARREWPALKEFAARRARLLPEGDGSSVLELLRGEGDTCARCYFNLSPRPQPLPLPSHRRPLFSSEAPSYQGGRPNTEPVGELLPWEAVVLGPAEWKAFF